jgi:hypothetical protein
MSSLVNHIAPAACGRPGVVRFWERPEVKVVRPIRRARSGSPRWREPLDSYASKELRARLRFMLHVALVSIAAAVVAFMLGARAPSTSANRAPSAFAAGAPLS